MAVGRSVNLRLALFTRELASPTRDRDFVVGFALADQQGRQRIPDPTLSRAALVGSALARGSRGKIHAWLSLGESMVFCLVCVLAGELWVVLE
jgi:hypothetical protein